MVARYVRVVVAAEDELDAKLLAEARQLEDRLGLTPLAMLRLSWSIEPGSVPASKTVPADELEEARRRLRPAASE
jgi:hypothetical protein